MTENQANKGKGRGPSLVLVFLGLGGAYLVFALYMGVVTPFAAVASNSMEPFLSRGDLVLVEGVAPETIAEGDVIVVGVPPASQQQYSYPSTIIHRVVGVTHTGSGFAFQTRGDNTGPDPFEVSAQDVKGRHIASVPKAGFLLLYFRSTPGLFFLAFATVVILVYLYGGEALQRGRKVLGGEQASPGSGALLHMESERLEEIEKGVGETRESLAEFSKAIAEYAAHLQSHTSAVRGISDASQELVTAVQRQNELLQRLGVVLGQGGVESTGGAQGNPEQAITQPVASTQAVAQAIMDVAQAYERGYGRQSSGPTALFNRLVYLSPFRRLLNSQLVQPGDVEGPGTGGLEEPDIDLWLKGWRL